MKMGNVDVSPLSKASMKRLANHYRAVPHSTRRSCVTEILSMTDGKVLLEKCLLRNNPSCLNLKTPKMAVMDG